MKTPSEIFLTLGVPLALADSPRLKGFRAFNEHDIKAIQAEAFKQGLAEGHNKGYLEGHADARKELCD